MSVIKYSKKALCETLLAIEQDFDGVPFCQKIKQIKKEEADKLARAFERFLLQAEAYVKSLEQDGKILPMQFTPANFYIIETRPGQLESDWLKTRNRHPDGFTSKKLSKHVAKEFIRLARLGQPVRISVGTNTHRLYGL